MFFENFTARKSTIKNENNKLIKKIEKFESLYHFTAAK